MEKQYDIFISYRRKDGYPTAKLLYDQLSQAGYRVFMDYEELLSGKFPVQLYDRIEECKEIIVVLGSDSLKDCQNEGDWLRLEIAHAIKCQKVIIPVMLRNFNWPKDLPADISELSEYQGIEASQELFDAFLKRLKKLLISKRTFHWKRMKGIIFYALIPIVITASVLFFVHFQKQKQEQKEFQQYEQVCKELVSLIGNGFVNGNQLLTITKDVKEEWDKFHRNLSKATEQNEKKRIKDDFCKYLDFKLNQVKDTTNLIDLKISPLYENVLSHKGIKTEDIKAYSANKRSEINSTKDYVEKVKYWAVLPQNGWPEEIDKGIGILAKLNSEMISVSIYAYMQIIISMPESVHENYLKILPMLSEYPTDVNFSSTTKELEAKQDLSFQKCNMLLQDYAAIVGNENIYLHNAQTAFDTLKSKVRAQANKDVQRIIAQKKDSLKAKKERLDIKKAELEQKKAKVREVYERLLTKDSFAKEDDQWLMWGKILHLASFASNTLLTEKTSATSLEVSSKEIFAEVQKRLNLYLEYNKSIDPNTTQYVAAAKQYFKLVSESKQDNIGILMIGTDKDAPHPVLKTGDIIVERKGKPIYNMDEYIKLKDDPNTNIIKIIRFNSSGKKLELTETIPSDCKVLVGFLNLKPKE